MREAAEHADTVNHTALAVHNPPAVDLDRLMASMAIHLPHRAGGRETRSHPKTTPSLQFTEEVEEICQAVERLSNVSTGHHCELDGTARDER